jgi:ribosomal protein L7/L12
MSNIATRKNIIAATLNINNMSTDKIKELALKLLEANPTIVLKSLEIGVAPKLYKVVVTDLNGETRKINVIKCFRELFGFGLGDSKAWAEGNSIKNYNDGTLVPSGVFAMNLSRSRAEEIMYKIVGYGLSWRINVVDNDTIVPPLPYNWTNPTV